MLKSCLDLRAAKRRLEGGRASCNRRIWTPEPSQLPSSPWHPHPLLRIQLHSRLCVTDCILPGCAHNYQSSVNGQRYRLRQLQSLLPVPSAVLSRYRNGISCATLQRDTFIIIISNLMPFFLVNICTFSMCMISQTPLIFIYVSVKCTCVCSSCQCVKKIFGVWWFRTRVIIG